MAIVPRGNLFPFLTRWALLKMLERWPRAGVRVSELCRSFWGSACARLCSPVCTHGKEAGLLDTSPPSRPHHLSLTCPGLAIWSVPSQLFWA